MIMPPTPVEMRMSKTTMGLQKNVATTAPIRAGFGSFLSVLKAMGSKLGRRSLMPVVPRPAAYERVKPRSMAPDVAPAGVTG